MIMHKSRSRALKTKAQLFAAIGLAVVASTQAVAQADTRSRREVVDANVYPWSSIGKIGNSVGGQCTGAVIGANQFLTAAHCLYYKAVRRLMSAEAFHLLLGYVRDEYRVHRIASKYVMSPTYDAPVEDRARPDDWVVLYVSDPFPPDIKPLVLADAVSPVGTAVKAAGYARERRYMMTADQHCRIEVALSDARLFRHGCLIEPGDSGGPVLGAHASEEGLILGINVAVLVLGPKRAAPRNEDFWGGIAVSAASIKAFLVASARSRAPEENVR